MWSFLVICALVSFLVFYILLPFSEPLLWAVLFTVIFNPLRDMFCSRLKSKVLSAFLIAVMTVLLLVVPVTIGSITAFREVVDLSRYVIIKYKQFPPEKLQSILYSLPLVKYLFKHLPEGVFDTQEIAKAIIANFKSLANFSASQVKMIFLSAGVLLFKLFIFVFAFFFLLKDADLFIQYIYRFIPLEDEDKRNILGSIYLTTLSVVYGTVGTALVQGGVSLIAYLMLGVPYPYLWALATSYASFIPPLGASMVWFPVSVYLFFNSGWLKGLIMVAIGLGVISSLDNIIKPMIMKNKVNAPYIVIFFAVFGGLIRFGFIGMFIGPILFNLLFTLAKIYEQRMLR